MKRKGRGVSTIYYPTGFNGGGDPDLATMHIKLDGTIELSNATCEMGQGFKTVAIQMAAEALGIGPENFTIDNSNTDSAAYSIDTAGSRATYIAGLAIISAAEDLIKKLKEFTAKALSCEFDELSYSEGRVFKTASPEEGMNLAQLGGATTFSGTCIVGCGGYVPPPGPPRDPETGATIPSRTMAYGSAVVDVEVDDETGVVDVINVFNCYDVGTVINPLTIEGQVDGGNIQGISMALFEDLWPNFPESLDTCAENFTDYIIPTFMDMPKHTMTEFYENYDPIGPFGAKGCGEMVTNTQTPAIINAIYDAVGVLVESMPASPEKILRLLSEKNA